MYRGRQGKPLRLGPWASFSAWDRSKCFSAKSMLSRTLLFMGQLYLLFYVRVSLPDGFVTFPVFLLLFVFLGSVFKE